MLTFVDPIAAKLERLESKPSLALESIDFTMRDRDAVREPPGGSARVLAAGRGDGDRAEHRDCSSPGRRRDDGYINRFLTVWQPDEQGHARALERLLVELDLEPFPLPRRRAGALSTTGWRVVLGGASERVHETVELIYHTIGAMNERLAFSAYERMSEVLVELGRARRWSTR